MVIVCTQNGRIKDMIIKVDIEWGENKVLFVGSVVVVVVVEKVHGRVGGVVVVDGASGGGVHG